MRAAAKSQLPRYLSHKAVAEEIGLSWNDRKTALQAGLMHADAVLIGNKRNTFLYSADRLPTIKHALRAAGFKLKED